MGSGAVLGPSADGAEGAAMGAGTVVGGLDLLQRFPALPVGALDAAANGGGGGPAALGGAGIGGSSAGYTMCPPGISASPARAGGNLWSLPAFSRW